MNLLEKFLTKTVFESYEDFQEMKFKYPRDFNFATHVVDAWAESEPEKKALVWCDDYGNEREFTFSEISDLSQRAAAHLISKGVKKGDRVMLIMKRRWEVWEIGRAHV